MNRLSEATSPYLLQHADNPVDWWPWSTRPSPQARARDVPVLLSVGYSACHWCHVMAHESFEDPQTAALLNENMVAIKVDREERPDVDAVYMAATQAMTGQGGWPMTVFMTPEGEPFFCGTYFPRAHFQRLVLGVAQGLARGPRRRRRAGRADRRRAGRAGRAAARAGSPRRAWGRCATRRWPRWPRTTTPSAAGSAGRRSSRRRWCWSSCSATPSGAAAAPARAAGRWRWRPAPPTAMARGGMYDQLGRRLCPVLGGRRLGGAALREDALRQRPARPGVRASVAPHRRPARPPRGPRDLRLDDPGAAHAGRRLRVGARRRQRGRGGALLHLDPGRARGGARRRGGAVRGGDVWRHQGRQLRAWPLGAAVAGRPGRAGPVRGRPRRLARGAGAAGPPGPRRQGGRGLERAGHRRPGRVRAAARRAWFHRGGGRRGRAARPRAPARRAGWRGPPGPGWPARAPVCWRTTPAWPRACWPWPG